MTAVALTLYALGAALMAGQFFETDDGRRFELRAGERAPEAVSAILFWPAVVALAICFVAFDAIRGRL